MRRCLALDIRELGLFVKDVNRLSDVTDPYNCPLVNSVHALDYIITTLRRYGVTLSPIRIKLITITSDTMANNFPADGDADVSSV